MTEQDFDIWLHGFAPETSEAPQRALCRVFGIPQTAAEALLASLPRVVKRDATLAQAERLVDALTAIGGRAEAVPTKVVAAKVVLVGQPVFAPSPTIVRHARPNAERDPIPGNTASADTIRIGTHELAAYFAPEPRAAAAATALHLGQPHDTLVEPTPSWAETDALPEPLQQATPAWADLELSPPQRAAPSPLAATMAATAGTALALDAAPATPAQAAATHGLEITRNVHDWVESVAHVPALSLEPPAAKVLSSRAPGAAAIGWQNPLELPAFGAPPPHGLTMRTAAERVRPRSMRPTAAPAGRARSQPPLLSDGLAMLARGELGAVARSHPSLAFLVVLVGTTLVFMVAYAAF